MIVNLKAHKINRHIHKLIRTPTLIKKIIQKKTTSDINYAGKGNKPSG